MVDIFSEIDAELKADRARRLMRRYGGYVLGAVLAIVLVVAAQQIYLYWSGTQRDNLAEEYQRARLSPTPEIDLTPITETSGGYAMLARFAKAKAVAESDPSEAEAIYLSLADDTSLAQLYRDAALILSVVNAADATDPDTLMSRLERIEITGGDSPWAAIRTELLIGLALKKGDEAGARAYLQEWQDTTDFASQQRSERLTTLNAVLNQNTARDSALNQ
ncbi:MAG: hypothetical protein MJE68_05065 [Proteobacteria bacterium]|nr:hypothetical protein [Pseudomonadota bacterium]